MSHEWTFLAAPGGSEMGFSPVVIAVCAKCGVIRAQDAPRAGGPDGLLNLEGECEAPAGRYSAGPR